MKKYLLNSSNVGILNYNANMLGLISLKPQYNCARVCMNSPSKHCIKLHSIGNNINQRSNLSSLYITDQSPHMEICNENWEKLVVYFIINAACFLNTQHHSQTPLLHLHTPCFVSSGIVRLLQMCIFMDMHSEVYEDTDFQVYKIHSALEVIDIQFMLVT